MNAPSLHKFPGGLMLEQHKELTCDRAIRSVSMPSKLVLPLQQHIGRPSVPCVAIGERVNAGQLIAQDSDYVGMRLHSPSTGVVANIGNYPVIHPSGLSAPAIEIACDDASKPLSKSPAEPSHLAREQLIERVNNAGIVGLGGAGFPAQVKLREGMAQDVACLIINGVECEPYITCDDRVLREHAHEILDAARLLSRLLQAERCVLALEEGMDAARVALEGADASAIEIVTVPAIYPAGGEKQLVTTLTGHEIPSGLLPIQIGVAMFNVQTLLAIYRAAIFGEPLTERVITLAGDFMHAGNYRVAIGTSVRALLEEVEGKVSSNSEFLSGGPMMGTAILDLDAPITKTTNCILKLPQTPSKTVSSCIRCGDCVTVCPVGLQPQQLYEVARSSDFDAAQDLHLFDCIECGCCAYVCPSAIPLVQHYRYAKSAIEALDQDRADADKARAYYVEKNARQATTSRTEVTYELADLANLNEATIRDDLAASRARSRDRRKQ